MSFFSSFWESDSDPLSSAPLSFLSVLSSPPDLDFSPDSAEFFGLRGDLGEDFFGRLGDFDFFVFFGGLDLDVDFFGLLGDFFGLLGDLDLDGDFLAFFGLLDDLEDDFLGLLKGAQDEPEDLLDEDFLDLRAGLPATVFGLLGDLYEDFLAFLKDFEVDFFDLLADLEEGFLDFFTDLETDLFCLLEDFFGLLVDLDLFTIFFDFGISADFEWVLRFFAPPFFAAGLQDFLLFDFCALFFDLLLLRPRLLLLTTPFFFDATFERPLVDFFGDFALRPTLFDLDLDPLIGPQTHFPFDITPLLAPEDLAAIPMEILEDLNVMKFNCNSANRWKKFVRFQMHIINLTLKRFLVTPLYFRHLYGEKTSNLAENT